MEVNAPDQRAEQLLAIARELERRDEAVGAEVEGIADLAERSESIRARAGEIAADLEALPAELEAVDAAADDARQVERRAQVELAEAEEHVAQLERSRRRREEDLDRARRTVVGAREAVADAEARLIRLSSRRDELRDVEVALAAEAESLAAAARDVAEAIGAVPRVSDAGKGPPGTTLPELQEWGSRARAALFVARGTLDAERERVVAEAVAFGTTVLGEDLAGVSVSLVRRRIEQALT